jgi:uncharacterized protein
MRDAGLSAGCAGLGLREWGKPMVGGARPAGCSDLVHRCCLVVCTAAITCLGAAALAAQSQPATKPAATSQQTAHVRTVRPHKVAVRPHKVARHARVEHASVQHARTDHRALSDLGDRVNNNTLGVMAGAIGSTDLVIAHELSAALDDGDNLRILPMVGAGGTRNIRDVRFMNGVDLGITQVNLLAQMRASGEIGSLDDKIVYIAKLFNEEMHVLVRADAPFTSIEQLAGHAVDVGEAGGGTQVIAHDVLDRLGVAVREVNLAEPEAIERLKAGEIDAVVLIGGKPVPALASLPAGFRLLAIPFKKPLRDDFLPAALSGEDYPGLLGPGGRVGTLAVGTVLIAYNWPKDSNHYRKIEKFVGAFFPQFAKLQASWRHPKWREVNLAATLPGWTRFAAAEDWLAQHRAQADSERESFERFVIARGGGEPASPEERERLFREYLQWSEARARR